MRAWYDASLDAFLTDRADHVAGRLADRQARADFAGTADQTEAWERSIAALQNALRAGGTGVRHVALEFDLIRLGRRIDSVLLTDRAVLVLEWKQGPPDPDAMRQAEDYALDLRDFHAGSRGRPIVPIVVAGSEPARMAPPMLPLWHGVEPTVATTPQALGALLGDLHRAVPAAETPLDPLAWLASPYRPVPGIVEAARMMFRRNGVADLVAARADAANLTRTMAAIRDAVDRARDEARHTVVVVTGIPGAGKTLCGLDGVFGANALPGSVFLTGNVPLAAVLRESLKRDAEFQRFSGMREPGDLARALIQNVHRFLDDNCEASRRSAPHERLVVFDEAQRAWDAAKATRKTQNRTSRLTASEPAHCLEILGRHPDWAVVIALIGSGQEINSGEAGLREWGDVIAANPRWRAVAAGRTLRAPEPRQRIADAPASWLTIDDRLDLTVPQRTVREPLVAPWVEALLAGRPGDARAIAQASDAFPVFVTRELPGMRHALRGLARGHRRAGIVRSSGAKRLRADGFDAEVSGPEVPNWFLNQWSKGDVRASDALEAAATEYACQGLELDVLGVAWGNDLRWTGRDWSAFSFEGTAWKRDRASFEHVRNTYRVLLTRARYETVVWVPRGDAADRTRLPAQFDPVADLLLASGARDLATLRPSAAPAGEAAGGQATLFPFPSEAG